MLTRLMLGSIQIYRRAISPLVVALFGPSCRFTPSCSRYASQSIERFGPFRGGWLALRRLMRCHPWSPGGEDPVPISLEARH